MQAPLSRKADSVVERVYKAVRHLAIAKGDVRSRLIIAGDILSRLRTRDFPEALRDDFEWVMQQLTRHDPVFQKERITATMSRVRNSTGEKIATRIWDIYAQLQEIRDRPLF